ncbi:hypothetical protein VPMS16_1851 [Vibrio sp. 16]|nr:hypothetical protein VPMS16_1851 [Vibrio sp. 16]
MASQAVQSSDSANQMRDSAETMRMEVGRFKV